METLTPLSYSHVVKILRDFLHQPPNHKHINKTSWLKLKNLLKKKSTLYHYKKKQNGKSSNIGVPTQGVCYGFQCNHTPIIMLTSKNFQHVGEC
jgi:S-adenosylmethionine synthetase